MKKVIDGCEPYFVAATYETQGYNTHDGKEWHLSSAHDIDDFKKTTGCQHIIVDNNNSADHSWFNRHAPQGSWAKSHDRVKRPDLRLPGIKGADALSGALGMFRSWMHACALLREISTEVGSFDLCYRIRFDLLFNKKVPHEDIKKIVGKDTVVCPDFCNFAHQGGCNDQFFCADLEVMQKALSIQNRLENYIIDDGQILHPETTFGYHLQKCGINKTQFPFDFVIKRTHGATHDLRGARR